MLTAILLFLGALNVLALPVEKNDKEKGDASYFLPDNVILPLNYDIMIDVSKSFEGNNPTNFTGSVIITALVNAESVKEITLHANQINIIGPVKVQTEEILAKNLVFDKKRDFLTIGLIRTLEKGENINITINYAGKLHDNMNGFYVSDYKENKVRKFVLTTQFQPTHARKAFPCFDEPKYKATFKLTFKKPKGYQVISNMATDQPNNGLDLLEVKFPATRKMSTYLLAFIVHEFVSKVSPDNSKYNVWSRPDAENQTTLAAKYVYKIVKDLNKFTKIDYEEYMNKMDMAALPDFSAGAMENWGLLTYRETALLVDEEVSTHKNIQGVVTVIAHEIAHQWFGDLVTTEWWMNTWLNEGFATYFEYHTTGNVTSGWQMNDQFVVEGLQSVLRVDSLAESTPLTLPVFSPKQISSHFGSISYTKGGSVIRMMEHFLGHNIFQEGLRHYLNENRLKSTVPHQLFSALQDIIDKNNVNLDYPIKSIMSNWISEAGYPVINVKNDSNGYVTFSQQRFFSNPEEKPSKTRWFVPISYTTSAEKNFTNLKPKLWLTPNEPGKTIKTEVDLDYIIVNIQEAGYYRVNYDENLWNKLAEVLSSDKRKEIHYINRAQIVDDVMNLARAGLVDYSTAFNVTDYLASETDYFPWYSAFQAFRFLLQRYSDNEDAGKELRLYLSNRTDLLVKDKEFVEDKNETQIDIFNKVAALEWACNLGHEKCIEQAKEQFEALREKNKPIPKDFRSIVYCTALRNGDKDDWDYLWEKFGASNSAAEKIGIINALGCSNDEKILEAYLKKSISADSGIRKQEASYVFTAVYTGNSIGVDVAFKFLQNNHQKIIDNYMGLNDLEKCVLGLASRLTDDEQLKEFEKILKSDTNFDTFKDAAIETVQQNVKWAKKYGSTIGTTLFNKRNSAASIILNKYVMFISLGFISIYLSVFN